MAVSKGRNYEQADIDGKYEVLQYMIYELPRMVDSTISAVEKKIDKEAKEAGDGDLDIEDSVRSQSPWHQYIESISELPAYAYQAAVNMIYSYTESTLSIFQNKIKQKQRQIKMPRCIYLLCIFMKKISACLQIQKKSKIEKIIEQLQRNYNLNENKNIKDLSDYWPNYQEFRKLRNHLVHEWKDPKHTNSLWNKDPQRYLKNNLERVYKMLRDIELVVNS